MVDASPVDIPQNLKKLIVLMLCAPSNSQQPFSYDFRVFLCFVCFLVKQIGINSENCIEYVE